VQQSAQQNVTRDSVDPEAVDEADYAAARSYVYRLFALAFEYPDDARLAALRTGDPGAQLRAAVTAIMPDSMHEIDWQAFNLIGEGDELQVEYTRLFDAGPSGPPCSLHEGAHQQSRMGTLEELVRFYNYFGLSRADEPNDLPDHLSTELEFLHYLSHCEAVLTQDGEDFTNYQRAQRDFLLRHPIKWLAKLKNKLVQHHAAGFYRELMVLLNAFLNHDIEQLINQVGRGKQDLGISLTTIDELPTKPEQENDVDGVL
jgi:putative dimethyl sulfoxide reductase chaperone